MEERRNARSAFRDLRHKLWWDRLDILYFATYAMWTYVSTPFVFAREDYLVSELDPWVENGEHWRRLAVTFPEHVHTHSREQVFYIDEDGLIRRHDYTAEPIGGWAKAAHYCHDHRPSTGWWCPRAGGCIRAGATTGGAPVRCSSGSRCQTRRSGGSRLEDPRARRGAGAAYEAPDSSKIDA